MIRLLMRKDFQSDKRNVSSLLVRACQLIYDGRRIFHVLNCFLTNLILRKVALWDLFGAFGILFLKPDKKGNLLFVLFLL